MTERISLKVHVEPGRCQGHNRCYSIAPELFEIDDYGNSRAKGTGAVTSALEEKARLAVKNCPEHAVRLTQGEAR
ncbi:MAG: ferredoxin [Burkholderiales bacterium]